MSRRRGVDDAAGLTSIDLREEVPAALDGLEPVLLGRMVDIDGATWRRGLLDEVAAVTWSLERCRRLTPVKPTRVPSAVLGRRNRRWGTWMAGQGVVGNVGGRVTGRPEPYPRSPG
jgi:hypothetical protein